MSQTMEELVGGMASPGQMAPNGTGATLSGFVNPNAGANQAAAPNASSGQHNALDFVSVVRQTVSATAMSPEGAKYVKELREYLASKRGKLPIEVTTLPYPAETLAITCGDIAFLLIFSEANRKDDNVPTCALTQPAASTLRSVMGDTVRMRNSIVVTPHDYSKVDAMGAHLINCFAVLTSSDIGSLDITSMRSNQIEISLNSGVYDDYVRRVDPHGVPARAPLSMLVSLNMPKKNNNNDLQLFDQVQNEHTEIAAVGAYVTFVASPDGTGAVKFLPEVHISSIVTNVPISGILPMLLALATDIFIDGGVWKNQFTDLGGSLNPNIGNLIVDPATNAPWRCETLPARDQFIANYCRPPVLILDVTEGRARVPGVEQFAIQGANAFIIDTYNRFLNTQSLPRNAEVGHYYCKEYDGFIVNGSTVTDSRWIDYLNAMIHYSSNKPQCDMLCMHLKRPEDMVNVKRNFCTELSLHYVTDMIVLEPTILRGVQDAVHRNIRTISGNTISGAADISAVLAASQGFIGNPANAAFQTTSGGSFGGLYGGGQVNLFS